jgi:hypothetical protein
MKRKRISSAASQRLIRGTQQRDLAVSYERIADVLKAQDNLPEALRSLGDSLAVRER